MASSILSGGQQASTIPTAMTTEKALPDWYTNYAMDILAGQQGIALQPYQPYGGPRIAGFTAPQQKAFEQTEQAASAYQPGLQQATQTAQNVNPYMGFAAAAPFLDQAGQNAYSQVNQYMNPYLDAVVNRIGEVGNRTLQEQVLPGIRDRFISGGSYGGSRNAEAFGRGVREAMEGISAQQSQALAQGYQGALGAAQADLQRKAGLAGVAGELGQGATSAGLQQAGALANMAQMAQQLGLTGAGALGQVGAQQQALEQQNMTQAYQDYMAQRGYPQEQINAMIKALQGVQPAVPSGVLEQGVKGTGYNSPSGLQGALGSVGTAVDFVKQLLNSDKTS